MFWKKMRSKIFNTQLHPLASDLQVKIKILLATFHKLFLFEDLLFALSGIWLMTILYIWYNPPLALLLSILSCKECLWKLSNDLTSSLEFFWKKHPYHHDTAWWLSIWLLPKSKLSTTPGMPQAEITFRNATLLPVPTVSHNIFFCILIILFINTLAVFEISFSLDSMWIMWKESYTYRESPLQTNAHTVRDSLVKIRSGGIVLILDQLDLIFCPVSQVPRTVHLFGLRLLVLNRLYMVSI